MTAEEVAQFYPLHVGESYFLDLVDYMTSGPSIALVLAKITPDERSVTDILKDLRGPKDVVCAKQERPDCLRARFGRQTSKGVENVIHSSDNQVQSILTGPMC
eukprot:sb/3478247/